VIKVLKPVELLLVEVVHFLRSYYLIFIEIDHTEPVVQRLHCAFVLFAKHEVHKILVAHFTWLLGFELPWYLIKDSVDCFAAKSMSLVTAEVLFVYYEVMVRVKLPKATVKYVKMFVAKELSNFVNIIFFGNCVQNIK
jgi:uncharacterized membrane protein